MQALPDVAEHPDAVALRRRLATGAILLGLVVSAFEGTVVTSAMPTITARLGGWELYAWVFSAFLTANTVGVLVCGRLADGYGRLPVFVGGMALFLAGSALCGAAQTMPQLVAFRVMQGLGAGAIQPVAMTISADLYSLKERAKIQSLFTTVWGGANVLGPILGAWIVMHLSWRWVFWVNVPVGIAAVVLLVASYRDPVRAERRQPGLAGSALAGASAALTLLALEVNRSEHPAWPLGCAIAAVLVGAAFVYQQRRATAPLIPASVLPERAVRAGIAGGLFAGAVLYACAAYVPLWLTRYAHRDALTAGGALVPLLAGWALGSTFGVHVLMRWGMRASVSGGFAIVSIGAVALLAVIVTGGDARFAYAALAVTGLGVGPAASTSLIGAQSRVGWQHRGMVTSVIYATRMLGGALMVGALGSVDVAVRFAGVLSVGLVATVVTFVLAEPGPFRTRVE